MPRFRLVFATDVSLDLELIERKFHRLIRDVIVQQLSAQPLLETKNRKALDPILYGATHELRLGSQNRFRVLYRVEISEENTEFTGVVNVLAIGEKRGAALHIARMDIE